MQFVQFAPSAKKSDFSGGRSIATGATAGPMTAEDEAAIRGWLALIEETDPIIIAEVIDKCERDTDARAYFIGRAAAELPRSDDPFPDDRRTCEQCANLIARRCQAAKRVEIAASRDYRPQPELLRRCEGYSPGPDDPDKRPGQERWPGLALRLSVNPKV